MASTSRPRQPKLRLSCDGCFLAKVKCSKQKPICTRCLSVGLDCRYSPSSRAGKAKSDSSNVTNTHAELTVCLPDSHMAIYPPAQHSAGLYRMESGWPAEQTTMDGMSRSHSIPVNLSMMAMEGQDQVDHMASDLYAPQMPWTTQADMSPGHYSESAYSSPMSHPHARSNSYDMTNGMAAASAWDVSQADTTGVLAYSTTAPGHPSSSSYFTAPPIPAPSYRPASVQSSRRQSGGGHCTCFTVCLQSLQALHNASHPSCPPLDMVLSLNSKAVEGCAAMLSCHRCMRRSGIHTAAMLLCTVIVKINSFYNAASRSYFESSASSTPASTSTGATPPSPTASGSLGTLDEMGGGLGVSIGNFRIASDDSRVLEKEILATELRKLYDVYSRFKEVCGDLAEDPMQDVGQAMVGYLDQNLGDTLEVVTLRRGDMGYR